MENLAQLIEKERTTLSEEKKKLEARLNEINRELAAVQAYEKAKMGATTTTTGTRRSGIRNDVLTAIATTTDGMNCKDILDHFGAKGDKKLEQSISNALSSLVKSGQTTRSAQGIYYTDTPRKD